MPDTIELRTFISTSLKEIILGVRDVQDDIEVQETGAAVSPPV